MLRPFLLLFALVLFSSSTRAADTLSTFKSGNWAGGGYAVDGQFSHCSMVASYPNNNLLLFKIYANSNWSVNWANTNFKLKVGEPITLQASVDGSDPVEIKGEVVAPQQIGFMVGGIASLNAYRKAARLRFYIQGATSVAFDLTGLPEAMDALHDCYRHHMGLDIDAARPAAVAIVKPPVSSGKATPKSDHSEGPNRDSEKGKSGSGVVINKQGQILTNAHVVRGCSQLSVGATSIGLTAATLVAVDERNDLAVIQAKLDSAAPIIFKEGKGLRAGEDVVVLGYPYLGILASEANVGRGSVTALSGMLDNSRFLQISAPIQPGNSGGPLLDMSGHLGGINTSTLDALIMVKATGSVPQNVNFSIKSSVARDFLDAKRITYDTAQSDHPLAPEEVSEMGRRSTVLVVCKGAQ